MALEATPFRVRFDWAKDGTFGTAGVDNVTDDVRGGVTASYGRAQSSALELLTTGRGSMALDNTFRRYSPGNGASPLAGNLKPARPVLIDRTVRGVTYTILRAHTDDQPTNPDLDSKRITPGLVDYLADFRRPTLSTELYSGMRTGEIVGLILDEIGWAGARDLDSGATVVPWWWEEGTNAYDALAKVVASEGSPALLTIGSSGEVVFRDRHHRLVRSASTTSQQTWRGGDDDPEPRMAKGFLYDAAWRNVVNDVTITVDERKPAGHLSTVWSTDESISINASDTETFEVATTDPFRDAVVPVADIDYLLLTGSVASIGLSRTNGASTVISITAGGSGARLQRLQLRAFTVPVVRQVKIRRSDSGSITDYGPAGLPSGLEPVWATRYDAVGLATLYVLQRKQPLPILTVRFVCGVGDEARLTKLLALDLSDRVTVVEPETGVNGDYFVENIQHDITDRTEHVITFGLEAAPVAASSPFVLGTSTLNGSATLGY